VRTKLAVIVAGLWVVMTAAVGAHHSFAAEYDKDRPVKITGVVIKIEWTNPHIWFFVDVKDEAGTVTNWAFSGGPPGVLDRRGISKHVLKPGDVVVVEGFRARDGSNNASGGSVTFPDGRRVFTASAEDALPKSDK
jgi:DNA/RNA endonuclease YhcR with UshA esterase domain